DAQDEAVDAADSIGRGSYPAFARTRASIVHERASNPVPRTMPRTERPSGASHHPASDDCREEFLRYLLRRKGGEVTAEVAAAAREQFGIPRSMLFRLAARFRKVVLQRFEYRFCGKESF